MIRNPEFEKNAEVANKLREIWELRDDETVATLEEMYPERGLPEGAIVTRIAPSPTGEAHAGLLYMAEACERSARASNGVLILRIEDTDKQREIPGSKERIAETLSKFGIEIDEGPGIGGEYGPYIQTEREKIYKACALELIEQDKAYICFASEDEVNAARTQQEAQGEPVGYYGKWSKWRDALPEEVLEELNSGKQFVIRLKNPNTPGDRIIYQDAIRGTSEADANYNDAVILKSDGIPTYHFAHVVDDHFMRTTHVIRGDEWKPSTPLHLELFKAMDWNPPIYMHLAPIEKEENGSRRKLSKRKDPEARADFYLEEGYPVNAVRAYLLNLLDSNFEQWRRQNPLANLSEYKFSDKGLKKDSGALFDFVKLGTISKEEIANMTAEEVFDLALNWAKVYDIDLAINLIQNPEYSVRIFNIERGGNKPRKDISKWSDIREKLGYFFDGLHRRVNSESVTEIIEQETLQGILGRISKSYSDQLSKDEWLELIKGTAAEFGYATDRKQYKQNPDLYKGFWGDITMVLRIMLTGRKESPDLYEVMKVMGQERVINRLTI